MGGHSSPWWKAPPHKYTVRYGLAPNAQNPFKGMVYNGIFNTARRVKGQILFVLLPVGTYYYIWNWADNYNKWLYTKAGSETLQKLLS